MPRELEVQLQSEKNDEIKHVSAAMKTCGQNRLQLRKCPD